MSMQQAAIIKKLSTLHNLNSQLSDFLKKLLLDLKQPLSLPASRSITSNLIQTICQSRNLLHYRHLDDRTTAEKCILLIEDIFHRIVSARPQIFDHITNQLLAHLTQHPSCFVSLAFFLIFVRKHSSEIRSILPQDRLRKLLNSVVSKFQEEGEVGFWKGLKSEEFFDWKNAQSSLETYLSQRFKPSKINQSCEEVNVSLSKIPPLVLPSSKSIQSSRYSAISKQERTKGLEELRDLASAIGEGFIAVELGCLLAHKRTQQVQEFSNNSDYRGKCLEKVETDRLISSRLSLLDSSYSQTRSGFGKQMDDTNKRYYKKALLILANLIHLCLQGSLNSEVYSAEQIKPFFLDFFDLSVVGVVDNWTPSSNSDHSSQEFFSTIKIQLLSIAQILKIWGERISFVTEKRHLKLLWNRNKKNSPFFYEEQLVARQLDDDFLGNDIHAIRYEHLKMVKSPQKYSIKNEPKQTDFIIGEVTLKINQLFSLCNMANSRFYKYQANILATLANYLQHSFSNTVKYLAIEMLFPVIVLIKRQIIELSHPFLDNIDCPKQLHTSKMFNKKQKHESSKCLKLQQPLFVSYPQLFSNFLLVISNLMSNHKHVERLISTIFIKNAIFMQTLERYVKYIFEHDMMRQIKKVLGFYKHCLQIYNQRKLRNQESKSIKILFNHLSAFFFPKIGCIANKLQEKQHLISSSPDLHQASLQEHQSLHQILDFIREIYYYCQDELAQNLLQQDIASFFIKYSLINFIKLYSFITVNELASLQSEGYELATKESPHISYYPSVNTVYMIDFIRIITSISINRTFQISKKIKQYRILEFFIRQFQLQFQVAENVEKYIRKVTKIMEVPSNKKVQTVDNKLKAPKIPPLSLKSQKFKIKTSPVKEEKIESKQKKKPLIPSLKLPIKNQKVEQKEEKGVLDDLVKQINNQKPKKGGFQLNLQLTRLSLNTRSNNNNPIANSSQRNLIYSSQRKIRKIYSNKTLHSEAILLVLSLLLNKGLLDPEYCDQFPITHGKINTLYILHHHLNQDANRSVIPMLGQAVGKIKPYLSGQRLLKLLSTSFTDLSHYKNWQKISAGAYGVIYGCETNIQDPRQVAIKEMNFPKSIYERCVLHDIFTEITCLQNFRLDERVTTMYNYGVISNSYVIVMKRYDCSLRDWILSIKDTNQGKINQILKVFWDILHIVLLLHQKSVTHYDIKADNIMLLLNQQTGHPAKVVIGDFGECRLYEHSKQELDMKSRGTQCIKSPQMLTLALHLKKETDTYDRRKKIGTTRASDIWSLGCLLYQMLTGQYLYHRVDWVNFYIQVTSPTEEILTKDNLKKLQKYNNHSNLTDYLRSILIRDPQHRPEIKGCILKFSVLFGDFKEHPSISKSALVIQKDLDILVNRYLQELKKEEQVVAIVTSPSHLSVQHKQHRVRGNHFMTSSNISKSNKLMRIMEDIFFCESLNFREDGFQKLKEMNITHVITTMSDPKLKRFNTLLLSFKEVNLAQLAFKLAPKISDLLREVLLLKGRLLFINDQTNYATNLLIYTLSYWFRCSVYQTWCLINTQILLFPTFTSDLLMLSSALRILKDIQLRVEELPKLQCICGSVTLVLKEMIRSKRKGDISCKCKRKKLREYANMSSGPQCVTTGCQAYLQYVKKRYSIAWQSLKWASMSSSNILSPIFTSGKLKQSNRAQILLNSTEPSLNMIQTGSCVKTCQVYSCKLCQMMIMATTESKEQILIIMNNMLRRVRQGIMIPNAQESYAKKTPALSFYTLTKLHMTKSPQE